MAFPANTFRYLAILFLLSFAGLKGIGQNPKPNNEDTVIEADFRSNESAKGKNSAVVIKQIELAGNNTTRRNVILREMIFSEGDTLYLDDLGLQVELSRRNLLNTGLFNFAEPKIMVDTVEIPHEATILFSFIERWYIWPFPRLETVDRTFAEWLQAPALSTINYGFLLSWLNFRGRREALHLEFQTGFSDLLWFRYNLPFVNRAKTLGVMIEAGLEQRQETFYAFQNNRPLRLKLQGENASSHFSAAVGFFYRRAIHNTFGVMMGFDHRAVSDTLLRLNPQITPGGRNQFRYLSLEGSFTHDRRDFKAYPLRGRFFQFRAKHTHLGFRLPEESGFTTFRASWREYHFIGSRWYGALGLYAGISLNNNSNLTSQLGIAEGGRSVRGYENYTIFGQHYFTVRSNLKYELVAYRKGRIPLLPGERFGLFHYSVYFNIFADAGYVADKVFDLANPLNNAILASAGIGIDFVTYYDVVVRTEFSITRSHPSLQIHFTAPI